ncbi:auxin response factor 11 [Striga asiatica]|uniref:Auxin response factor 11 n=1 Tax=Striga asiatica TaxID=4170 RepID=A0A5A7Q1U4_STRAF|nr:auxin response factor 11 [Striga asiatica]
MERLGKLLNRRGLERRKGRHFAKFRGGAIVDMEIHHTTPTVVGSKLINSAGLLPGSEHSGDPPDSLLSTTEVRKVDGNLVTGMEICQHGNSVNDGSAQQGNTSLRSQ